MQALRESPQLEPAPDLVLLPDGRVSWTTRIRPRLRQVAPASWVAAGIAVLMAFNSLWRLTTPSWHVDEILFAISGRAMVRGDFSHLQQHPPLGQFVYGVGQLLPGGPLLGVRLVAAALGCATGGLLYVLGRRIGGQRCGLLAAAMWAGLPHITHPLGRDVLLPRLDRYGLLDVVAAAFMLAALITGWQWITRGGRRSRILTGLLIGLATAAKLTGVLVLPGIAAFVVWYRRRRGALEVVQASLVTVAVFAVCYVPFGWSAPDALRHMAEFQSEHLARGHSVVVDGVVRRHAPWWAQLDFMWQGDGPLVIVPLVVASAVALVLLRRPAVTYVALAVAVPFVVMSRSGVSLPHYRYVWLAPFFLLAALGFDRALRARDRLRRLRFGAFVLTVPLLVAALGHTWQLATLERADYGRAADLVRDAGLDRGRLLVHGHTPVLRGELPDMVRVWQLDPGDPAPDVVLVDRLYERRHPRPEVRDVARLAGLRRVRVDRLDVWLRSPS